MGVVWWIGLGGGLDEVRWHRCCRYGNQESRKLGG